jgi:ubiquinone/menaquinone biosynthesis C-methylase UbiE
MPSLIQVRNQWPSDACAKAFWAQQLCPPYQRLLQDTIDWVDPGPKERWLDLGCGGGSVTRALWERTKGTVGAVIGLDCAAANGLAYKRLRETLGSVGEDRIQFIHHDFSSGLGLFGDSAFDHAVSGLSISYAESYDESTGRWTSVAYDRLLAELWRVIRPGGRLVFSVNVPEPSWATVAWRSIPSFLGGGATLSSLKKAWRMLRYGRWLKREARIGRFHYLPEAEVRRKLISSGFASIDCRMSYCDQAYIFRAVKPI